MNTTTHQALADLWLMPAAELDTYLDVASQIRALRSRIEPNAPAEELPAPVSHLPVLDRSERNMLVRRAPLREPKPGSLRAAVHDVLRESSSPMRRAEVIASVAALRNVPVNDTIKAKVGDVLTSRHDPFIKKLAQGVYAFAQPEVLPCL